jgi:two-component system NtrC family sensor kinase/two-component system sensor histidine kinase AtoS
LSSTLKKRVLPENIPIVEEIQKSVYRIDRIIKATLMFSKGVQANQTKIRWRELKESIDMAVGYYAYSKEISFTFPEEDFTLYADKDLLEMLFSNFIINAIDAIELDENEDGKVEINYKFDEKYHIFNIFDSGVDIEDKSGLFEAFKSTKVKGNGLGLVLSRQIAEAHGGSVELLDTDKKCFEIKLAK